MRDQIPALVEKCVFLSDEARSQVLNNYKTLPEERIALLIQKLTQGYEKQQAFLKKKEAEKVIAKRKLHEDALRKLKEEEMLSRQQETLELQKIENEINSLF